MSRGDWMARETSPSITVIETDDDLSVYRGVIQKLSADQARSSVPTYAVVYTLTKTAAQKRHVVRERRHLLAQFACPDWVEIATSRQSVEDALANFLAKCQINQAKREAPRSSPLDAIQAVIDVTADLRESGGNLSARIIADLYDIKMAELARLLGRTPQALSKTPDADTLQNDLAYFERIARLRLRLKDDDSFRKWLRMKNPQLDGHTPLDVLKMKKWQELADYVDDMLTGAPA
ncbi:MAG TPA: MbcA/ParS/Xre antitoxin family protein [Kiritimatiellia bacterium]|nr:MbcA/ParS/Xre antitoxin family protein [Kiritimatiellia bacterium]